MRKKITKKLKIRRKAMFIYQRGDERKDKTCQSTAKQDVKIPQERKMKDAYSNNGDIQACNSSSQYDIKGAIT